jgi:site-specific DNA recombinase
VLNYHHVGTSGSNSTHALGDLRWQSTRDLFSGRTKSGECGAGFIVCSREQLGCFGARARGTCTNKLTIPRPEVDRWVLRALQDKLMRKDFFEEFCREFAKEMNRLRMEQGAGITSAKRELARIEARKKLIDLVLDDQLPASEVRTN